MQSFNVNQGNVRHIRKETQYSLTLFCNKKVFWNLFFQELQKFVKKNSLNALYL